MSKLDEACKDVPTKLFTEGCVIAVDPSCGSRGSMPAFALASGGFCCHAGRIELDLKLPLHRRLFQLQQELVKIVVNPDVVAIESLPPFMAGAGGDFRTARTVALHQSAGCIMATWDVQYLLPVAVISHQSLMKKLTEGKYVKSDENDAIAILITAFRATNVRLKNEADLLKGVCK